MREGSDLIEFSNDFPIVTMMWQLQSNTRYASGAGFATKHQARGRDLFNFAAV